MRKSKVFANEWSALKFFNNMRNKYGNVSGFGIMMGGRPGKGDYVVEWHF